MKTRSTVPRSSKCLVGLCRRVTQCKVMNSSSVITVCWKRIAMTLVFSIIVTARCPDSYQTKLRLCDGAASVRTSWAPQLLRFLAWLQERLLHIFV